MRLLLASSVSLCLAVLLAGPAHALRPREADLRLEARSLPDPSAVVQPSPRRVEDLPAGDPLRLSWQRFAADRPGGPWHVHVDARSGAPLAVLGPGLDWPVAPPQGSDPDPAALAAFEGSLRVFLRRHRDLLQADDAELVFDRAASGPVGPQGWRAVFRHEVKGVPVEGDQYAFTFGYGRLILFGAARWTPIAVDTTPMLTASGAVEVLQAWAGGGAAPTAAPSLHLVPGEDPSGRYAAALAWRVTLAVDGDPGAWVGLVDAHDAEVLAFYDDARYSRVQGGVHPESADDVCPSGCEQPGFPMPFAQVAIDGTPQTSNALGVFACGGGASVAASPLQSPTIRISDACGAISEFAPCGTDLDLSVNAGTNCAVPAGHGAGDTKAARTTFYTTNRLKEHARAWLPANAWLSTVQTQVNTNVNSVCNALWLSGVLSVYREGSGCRNTGTLSGVIAHEWGHGLDENDGGGFTSPAEGYADIAALLADHTSCIGRGFYMSGTCAAYGNACLTCTGIRETDWDRRASHLPMNLTNVFTFCPTGGGPGPCGRLGHCEGQVVGEAVWDLAVRDLPAAGLDAASAWQLVDRLWYATRNGASGPMYQCVQGSGGCLATGLYLPLLAADDDNGNLLDGTPHMTAIHAAFNRHGIACPNPAPVSSGGAPVATLSLGATGGAGSVALTWAATPLPPDPPASFRVLRSDLSCSAAFTRVATVPAGTTSYTDAGLPNGFALYYRVQAVGSNAAHESAVSNCVSAAAVPTARPVPQMTASRVDPTRIAVSWDAGACPSSDHEILYGSLGSLSSLAPLGAVCALGTSGAATWTGVPAGNLWFVVTGISGAGTEATWGQATAGPRGGATPSGLCGNAVRDNAASCP